MLMLRGDIVECFGNVISRESPDRNAVERPPPNGEVDAAMKSQPIPAFVWSTRRPTSVYPGFLHTGTISAGLGQTPFCQIPTRCPWILCLLIPLPMVGQRGCRRRGDRCGSPSLVPVCLAWPRRGCWPISSIRLACSRSHVAVVVGQRQGVPHIRADSPADRRSVSIMVPSILRPAIQAFSVACRAGPSGAWSRPGTVASVPSMGPSLRLRVRRQHAGSVCRG